MGGAQRTRKGVCTHSYIDFLDKLLKAAASRYFEAVKKFKSIFSTKSDVAVHYVPGNTDIWYALGFVPHNRI